MAQIDEDFARRMIDTAERGKHTALTSWEQQQLAYAWLQVRNLRACLRDANGYSDEQISEIANRGLAKASLKVVS